LCAAVAPWGGGGGGGAPLAPLCRQAAGPKNLAACHVRSLARLRVTVPPSHSHPRAQGGIKKALFHHALSVKKANLHANDNKHGLYDALVFSKVKLALGLDRCRLVITGSAPIAEHVMEFLRAVFGVAVLEGYGQTECSAAACVTSPSDFATLGHVGGPGEWGRARRCAGVVWCGVVWCGVVWCGVVWYGMVWYDMVWSGMIWCGVV
jgi:hypothetical protein